MNLNTNSPAFLIGRHEAIAFGETMERRPARLSWVQKVVLSQVLRMERRLGASMEYLRQIGSRSIVAVMKIALVGPFGTHRRKLPAAEFHVARLVATLHEDCGESAQNVVNLAQRDGISNEVLAAVLAKNAEGLPGVLQDVHAFAGAVLQQTGEDIELREIMRARYGEEALIELSMAIASARILPTLKRSLGYSVICSMVKPRPLHQDLMNQPNFSRTGFYVAAVFAGMVLAAGLYWLSQQGLSR